MSDFGNIVDTVTQDYLVPQITDNVSTGSPLLMRFLQGRKDAKAWGNVNGPQVLVPIKYVASTVGGWYSGFDTFSTNQVNTRVNATFKPKQLYFTVGASGIQIGVNKGPQATLDFLTTEMGSVATDMWETLATGLYSDGTGTSSKQLDGLRTAVVSSGTYAGLAPGTYTTWVSDLDSSSNAITLAEVAASFEAATIGASHPTIMVTTPAIFVTIEGLCMGTISFNNPVPGVSRQVGTLTREGVKAGVTGEAGFTALSFRGVPIISDEKCPSGYFYLLNEDKMGLAMWPYPDFPGYVTKPNYNGFCWTGLKVPTNQDASVGQFLFYTQLVTNERRAHSYMTGKT